MSKRRKGLRPPRSRAVLLDPDRFAAKSDDTAWDALPLSRSGEKCEGGLYAKGIDLLSGEIDTYRVNCGTYGHRPCAESKVDGQIERFLRGVQVVQEVYYGVVQCDEWRSGRIGDRMYAKRGYSDDGYVWVRRKDDPGVFVFSTINLPGSAPPKSLAPVPTDFAALMFVEWAVRLPGLTRVQFSKGWGKGGDAGRGHGLLTRVDFGRYSEEEWDRVAGVTLDLLADRYGLQLDSIDEYRLHMAEVPVSAIVAAIYEAKEYLSNPFVR